MEKLTELTDEQKNFAIDLMVTLVVDELANELPMDRTKLLQSFVASKTGALLYDEASKLWWNGPSYIAEMYKMEMSETKETCV